MFRRSLYNGAVKKAASVLFCAIMILCLIIPAHAATAVPQEVLNAADSVVFIGIGSDTENYHPDQIARFKKENPDAVFTNGGKVYFLVSSGSGFVIKNSNREVLIVTNNHVVESDFDRVFVWLTRDKVAHAEVIFALPEKDLSVIRIREATDKKPLRLVTEDALRGDAAYAVGFPGAANEIADGIASTSDEAIITDGIISSVRELTMKPDADPVKLFLMNVSVNHGNSGGPLLDANGNVIGINTLKSEETYGAVAISELWSLLKAYNLDISVPAQPPEVPAESPPTETGKNGKNRVLLAGAVIVCAAVLLAVVRKFPVDRKTEHFRKEKEAERRDKELTDHYFVRPVITDDSDPGRTSGVSAEETTEKTQSAENYFKSIKLDD